MEVLFMGKSDASGTTAREKTASQTISSDIQTVLEIILLAGQLDHRLH